MPVLLKYTCIQNFSVVSIDSYGRLLHRPDVDFDVRLMRAVQVMDIPMLKDFINALVMDSLTYGKKKISSYLCTVIS